MAITALIYREVGKPIDKKKASLLILAWAAVVVLVACRHVVWRDEVRALSIALSGAGVADMLQGLRGDGHPAVWYLLLRGAHAILPVPQILSVVSIAVALAAAAVLVFRSPFSLPFISLLLMGKFLVYEYSVMSRNYGISMLLIFCFASLYETYRCRSLYLGILLLLLANCNAHSIIIATLLTLFWAFDVSQEFDERRTHARSHFPINISIVALGIIISILTIYPTYNDAAQLSSTNFSIGRKLLTAILLPATSFQDLFGYSIWRYRLESYGLWRQPYIIFLDILMSALLFCSLLGLTRRPAALLTAGSGLIGLSCFFATIYPGAYRHQSLWLLLLICTYWIVRNRPDNKLTDSGKGFAAYLGIGSVVMLISLQLVLGLHKAIPVGLGLAPESRSRDFANFVKQNTYLSNATVIAEPDYLVESLPYYLTNKTYLMREARYGNVVKFTSKARLTLSLSDIVNIARRLRADTGQPVLILMRENIELSLTERVVRTGYNWKLSLTPSEIADFLLSTRLLIRFDEVYGTDESFAVYILN